VVFHAVGNRFRHLPIAPEKRIAACPHPPTTRGNRGHNAGAISDRIAHPGFVGRELRIIRDDLHCNAERIIGSDAECLELATTLAAEVGPEVWCSPFTSDFDRRRGAGFGQLRRRQGPGRSLR
jgi:hypothetical protein